MDRGLNTIKTVKLIKNIEGRKGQRVGERNCKRGRHAGKEANLRKYNILACYAGLGYQNPNTTLRYNTSE